MSESRALFLNEMNSFIIDNKNFLCSILSKLDWSEDTCDKKNENEVQSECIAETDKNNSDVYTQNERCDINDFLNLPQNFKKEKEKSLLDILAKERDMKRRRISYKGRIHTKHKSHNEILREVISQQMDMIGETVSGEPIPNESIESSSVQNDRSIDLSRMYIENPHLAWKYVSKEYKEMLIENKIKKNKPDSSKQDRHNNSLKHDSSTYRNKNHEDKSNSLRSLKKDFVDDFNKNHEDKSNSLRSLKKDFVDDFHNNKVRLKNDGIREDINEYCDDYKTESIITNGKDNDGIFTMNHCNNEITDNVRFKKKHSDNEINNKCSSNNKRQHSDEDGRKKKRRREEKSKKKSKKDRKDDRSKKHKRSRSRSKIKRRR